jgi:hypothetical protein
MSKERSTTSCWLSQGKVPSNKQFVLFFLHAITKEEPLCERDEFGKPVDDLKRKGDTSHLTPREDGKLTCETL